METLQRTANRGSISTGYDIDYSLKNESDNGERFQSVNLGTPTSVRTFTFSMWVKRTELAAYGSQPYILNFQANTGISVGLQFAADSSTDSIYYTFQNSSVQAYGKTKAVFRDTSAWMHIVWRVDTTQSTATDRVRIYVNGVDQEIESGGGGHPAHPNQNYDVPLQTTQYLLGYDGGNNGFCGYASEYVYVDGQSLAPTAFGETDSASGIWKPIDLSNLTFGNAGYYLDFADASALGKDVGNSKGNFSHYGGSAADQATDTPTNNFCTFNPLMDQGNSPTISEGAMKSTGGGGNWNQTWGSIGVKNGKWYYEFKVTNANSTGYFGASTTPAVSDYTNTVQLMYNTSFMVGSAARIDYYYWQNGSQVSNESTGWGTISTNDIIGIALDLDSATKTFTVYKNGTALSGTLSQPVDLPTNMQDEFIFPLYVQYENKTDEANFGGYTISNISSAASDGNGYGTFEYAPPTGYYALCTKNLARFG